MLVEQSVDCLFSCSSTSIANTFVTGVGRQFFVIGDELSICMFHHAIAGDSCSGLWWHCTRELRCTSDQMSITMLPCGRWRYCVGRGVVLMQFYVSVMHQFICNECIYICGAEVRNKQRNCCGFKGGVTSLPTRHMLATVQIVSRIARLTKTPECQQHCVILHQRCDSHCKCNSAVTVSLVYQ